MKTNIHPAYHQATVTCACGNTFTVGSTAKDLHVDICSNCHPFFTGEQKFIDILGRVDKFMAKRQAAAAVVPSKKKAKKGKGQAAAAKPMSLREMLTVTRTDKGTANV